MRITQLVSFWYWKFKENESSEKVPQDRSEGASVRTALSFLFLLVFCLFHNRFHRRFRFRFRRSRRFRFSHRRRRLLRRLFDVNGACIVLFLRIVRDFVVMKRRFCVSRTIRQNYSMEKRKIKYFKGKGLCQAAGQYGKVKSEWLDIK